MEALPPPTTAEGEKQKKKKEGQKIAGGAVITKKFVISAMELLINIISWVMGRFEKVQKMGDIFASKKEKKLIICK